jgi:gamma-glutamylcyclotransferase (GGCT)/AIG2-like uncharacterized protein YtfP
VLQHYPLFVYGTLLQGQPNHHLLKGRIERIVPGWIEGVELFLMGGYPMAVECRPGRLDLESADPGVTGPARVVGQVVYLRSVGSVYAATVELLDRLEGVVETDGTAGLFRRVVKRVFSPRTGELLAWVYLGKHEMLWGRPRIDSGDWLAYQGEN